MLPAHQKRTPVTKWCDADGTEVNEQKQKTKQLKTKTSFERPSNASTISNIFGKASTLKE